MGFSFTNYTALHGQKTYLFINVSTSQLKYSSAINPDE